MKTGKYLALAVLSATLLVTAAYAKNEASLTLGGPTVINSQQLRSGDYQIRWEGTGNTVQVQIVQGKKVVATSTAEVVPQAGPANHTQAILLMQDNGTRKLQRIDLPRQKISLVFGDNATGSGQ